MIYSLLYESVTLLRTAAGHEDCRNRSFFRRFQPERICAQAFGILHLGKGARRLITQIESRQNAALRHLARLTRDKKYRRETGEMVCEGEKLLVEALSSGVPVRTVLLRTDAGLDPAAHRLLAQAQTQGARLCEAAPALFALASDVETPQGVIFSCAQPRRGADGLPPALSGALLLDGVQDPGNLGTILRTADAFSLDAVILCEGCADPFAPKTVRATMGAIFRQPLYHIPLAEAVRALSARGLPVYAAALEPDSVPATALDLHGAAVIVGSEGRGVTQQALSLCTRKVIIPMRGRAESLNAGVAASILIWEMTREA